MSRFVHPTDINDVRRTRAINFKSLGNVTVQGVSFANASEKVTVPYTNPYPAGTIPKSYAARVVTGDRRARILRFANWTDSAVEFQSTVGGVTADITLIF